MEKYGKLSRNYLQIPALSVSLGFGMSCAKLTPIQSNFSTWSWHVLNRISQGCYDCILRIHRALGIIHEVWWSDWIMRVLFITYKTVYYSESSCIYYWNKSVVALNQNSFLGYRISTPFSCNLQSKRNVDTKPVCCGMICIFPLEKEGKDLVIMLHLH